MYNLDNIVRIYFNCVAVKDLIEGRISYQDFPEAEFLRLARVYVRQYSDTEDSQLYQYLKNSINEEGHPFAGMENRSGLNVFAALEELAEQLLTMAEGKVKCCYSKLLRYRNVTKYLDEDLLVCAYLAMRYKRFREEHENFNWNTAIGHNNVQLNRILQRGMSENHFHLYGSAPYFQLLWIYLMNHPGDGILHSFSKTVEDRQRSSREHYRVDYAEDRFAVRILKASLIRIAITYYLLGWTDKTKDGESGCKDFEGEFFDGRGIRLSRIEDVLSDREDIEICYYQIQEMIDYVREYAMIDGEEELADYALYTAQIGKGGKDYAGERWLIYRVLWEELTEGGMPVLFYQWLYAYLVIKHSVRSELLQVNDTVGFENFSIYSRRKNCFRDYQKLIEYAVHDTMENQNIRKLELRIKPEQSAQENASSIREIREIIGKRENCIPESSYYFVFHFTKRKDDTLPEKNCFDGLHCRHYRNRKIFANQANAIYHFRESYREEASLLLGIDACSQEIGCRPEVFAPVYRFLSEHIAEEVPVTPHTPELKQLKKTFHVGEDFLDIVDGLRAVDEAVRFLNLQCGDRIGHGTVLGINVKKWYEFKENTIVLPQMDYLDNIVWLYHKLIEYNIADSDRLRELLLKDFELYFSKIYRGTVEREGGEGSSIHTYYEAWKLRGDDPELYISGKFEKYDTYANEWLVNRSYPETFENREREEVSRLYYLYHYNWDVRNEGDKSVQIYVSPAYIEGVDRVQNAMGKEFASKGIGVETNPSSNLVISTIQSYAEHPILRMYNRDITWDVKKLEESPQINVSVNTDDRGVFHTSLENEYALLACAMEKARDEEGNLRFNRQNIYQWIDNIREMGNLQSFSPE